MTTVVSPGSSPVPVYNKSGVTIESISANGLVYSGAAQITRHAGKTVVIVVSDASNRAVILPDTAEIGDTVEVYSDQSDSVYVFPFSGDSIYGASPYVIMTISATLRKLAANVWGLNRG